MEVYLWRKFVGKTAVVYVTENKNAADVQQQTDSRLVVPVLLQNVLKKGEWKLFEG